ncbi:zinc knuckle CX2CX4HX4C containing protein [Tanacetum coccineum]
MRDPEPKDSDSTLPPKGSSEFIKPRRYSRSSISKPPVTSGVKSAKRVSFKAGKGSDSLKNMEEDVRDGYDHKNEDFYGDLELNTFSDSQSIDSRSCVESIAELQANLEKELVSEIVSESVKGVNASNVADSSMGNVSDPGPIPMPVKDNPLLSTRTSLVGSPRISKKGEILTDGGNKPNAGDTVMGDNEGVKRPSSFINAIQGARVNGNNKLRRIPVSIDENGKKAVDIDHVIEEAEEGMQYVLENGLWLVDEKPLFIQNWEAGMCMVKPEPSKVPLWVRIMNIPLEAWNSEGISRIASYLGNPIIMDRITTSMCEKYYRRASFARVLVEIKAETGLVDEIEIFYRSLGRSMKLRVEYPWKPPVCTHCKVFGHGYDRCPNRNLTDAEKTQGAEMRGNRIDNEGGNRNCRNEWQTANNRRIGTSRGGFNGRGRGGFGGRGSGNQRFSRSENPRYVPVKKNSNDMGSDGRESVQNNKDKDKIKAKVNGSEPSNQNEVISEKKGIDGSGKNKKKINREDLETDNMFSVLTDEVEIEKRVE